MLLTPIVVGLMWRALLNPEWGLLNWVAVKLGFGYVGWLSDPTRRDLDARPRRLVAVDAVRLRDRLRPPAGAAAGGVRGRLRRRRQLVPAHAATSRCRCSCRRSSSRRSSAAIDAFRTFDLVYGLTNGGPVQATIDALLRGVPERLRVPALRLRVGGLLRHGDRRRDRHHAAVPVVTRATRGRGHVSAPHLRPGRLVHRAGR